MLKGLVMGVLPLHALFVLLLYVIGNFFIVVVLEYRLKSDTLKHTIAAFASVLITALCAYFIPLLLLGDTQASVAMKIVTILAGLAAQVGFWWFWFRNKFKTMFPALALAFGMTVVVSLLLYIAFLAYVGALMPSGGFFG